MKKTLFSLAVIWFATLLGVTGLFWLNQSMKQQIQSQANQASFLDINLRKSN